MKIFDKIEPATLEQRDMQLWVLALAMLLIFATGVALLIYPAAIPKTPALSEREVRGIFVSFCVLSSLLIVYLIERQITIRQLRLRLKESQQRTIRLLSQASADLLATLPGFEHFQDRLAMEFRRAANLQQAISLIVISLKPAKVMSEPEVLDTAYGDAAKAIVRKLRGEDSIYLFAPGIFGVVLPGVRGVDANRVAVRLGDGLNDASGAGGRFSCDLRVLNYPEHVNSAREMEQVVRSYFADGARQMEAA